MTHIIRVAVSGIPRGYHFPQENGNWLQPHHRRQIQSISKRIELIELPAHEVLSTDVSAIEILLAEGGNRTHYPGELDWSDYLHFFSPSLKWVQVCSTGFGDNLAPQVLDKRTILTNAPGIHTIPIAESVIGAMLYHAKNFATRTSDKNQKIWHQLYNTELFDQTVLIIGLGRIGQKIATLCQAFNMHVIGTKRHVTPVENVNQVFEASSLAHYLPQADYVVIAVPLTPDTENMLSEKEFAMMKKSAYLINIGRGKVCNEANLLSALKNNTIAGAYLDVFGEEPLSPNHPLWELPNVFFVPHDSHSSPRIGDRMIDLFCANLERYIHGKTLHNICNPQRGY